MVYKKYSLIAESGYMLLKYKNIFIGILSGLLLSFFLMTESMSDNIPEKKIGTPENGSKSGENLPKEQSEKVEDLSLMLVGVVLVDGEEPTALIVYKNTGERGVYKVGETIGGAKVVEINQDNVVIEKDGKRQTLVLKGDRSKEKFPSITNMDPQPPLMENSGGTLPHFKPVESKTGPPADKSIPVKDLPHFKPVTNETGPPSDKSLPLKDLPPFEPVESKTGPPELKK